MNELINFLDENLTNPVAEHYLDKIAHYDRYGHILLPKPIIYERYAERALNEIELIMSTEEVDDGSDTG